MDVVDTEVDLDSDTEINFRNWTDCFFFLSKHYDKDNDVYDDMIIMTLMMIMMGTVITIMVVVVRIEEVVMMINC